MVLEDGRILLGMKKRGFGAGMWNGFGGKVEAGETIENAARREMREEAGLEVGAMHEVGNLEFSFESYPDVLEVHIFRVIDRVGTFHESEEMRPQWFALDEIPFSQMWPDDEQWFPYLLSGVLFRGTFHFDRPSDASHTAKILRQEIAVVGCL